MSKKYSAKNKYTPHAFFLFSCLVTFIYEMPLFNHHYYDVCRSK